MLHYDTVQKVTNLLYILHVQTETPCEQISTKFCRTTAMVDVIICADFCVE